MRKAPDRPRRGPHLASVVQSFVDSSAQRCMFICGTSPPNLRSRTISYATPDPVLLDVIRLIDSSPRLSQRKVASSLGVSLGKVNFCIRALIEKGFLKAENYRNSGNKLAYVYLLTPSGIVAKAELTRYFLARKVAEYEALRIEIEQLQKLSEGTA